MKTKFNVSFIENLNEENTLVFLDLSVYNPDIPISTPKADLTFTDFNKTISFIYEPNKVNQLKLSSGDGLYILTLSICPNDKLYKSFSYYHISNALMKLKKYMCDKTLVEKSMDVYKYLMAAQLAADCPDEASLYYSMATNLLSKLECNGL